MGHWLLLAPCEATTIQAWQSAQKVLDRMPVLAESTVVFHTTGQKTQRVPGEDAPAWPPTGEHRPPTHIPEAGEQVDSKGQDKPQLSAEPCLFLGVALLVSSMFSDLCCKGCHPKAVCPRQLTQWTQEPVLTLTSNNRQIQQQATFLKVKRRPCVYQSETPGAGERGRSGPGVPSLGQLQHHRHRRL